MSQLDEHEFLVGLELADKLRQSYIALQRRILYLENQRDQDRKDAQQKIAELTEEVQRLRTELLEHSL